MKKIALLIMAILLLPLSAAAGSLELRPGLKVVLPEVPAPWIVNREPMPSLVEHIAEHVREEAAEKGKTLTKEQSIAAARKRLQGNDLFVLNPQSEAHVMISFEPLREGEAEPSPRAIAASAKYAAEGVTDEGWSDVSTRQAKTTIKGAQQAEWFEIGYSHEGKRNLFLGVVGFARPYWFWLYANDHLRNPADRAVLEKLLREIEIRVDK